MAHGAVIFDDAEIEKRQRKFSKDYEAELSTTRSFGGLLVLSYPKAGRTWHRLMLGIYLARCSGLADQRAFDLDTLTDAASTKPVLYSHNGANFLDWLPPHSSWVANPALWAGKSVLLIVRNPKDLLVSCYHHARFRSHSFSGSLSDFVRDPRTGIVKVLTARNRWHRNRSLAATFEIVTYEQMHKNPEHVLRHTLRLLGIGAPDGRLISAAVSACSLEKMKGYELTDFFKKERLRNDTGDQRASKVREGLIGGFKRHLSPADEAYVDEWTARLTDPFAPDCR